MTRHDPATFPVVKATPVKTFYPMYGIRLEKDAAEHLILYDREEAVRVAMTYGPDTYISAKLIGGEWWRIGRISRKEDETLCLDILMMQMLL